MQQRDRPAAPQARRAPVDGDAGGGRHPVLAVERQAPPLVETVGAQRRHVDDGDVEGWLSDGPLSSWYGVSTDAKGRVTRLSLANNELSGTLPPELGDLSSLAAVYLYQNAGLSGPLPSEMGRLAGLGSLYTFGTGLCLPPALADWHAAIGTKSAIATCGPASALVEARDAALVAHAEAEALLARVHETAVQVEDAFAATETAHAATVAAASANAVADAAAHAAAAAAHAGVAADAATLATQDAQAAAEAARRGVAAAARAQAADTGSDQDAVTARKPSERALAGSWDPELASPLTVRTLLLSTTTGPNLVQR